MAWPGWMRTWQARSGFRQGEDGLWPEYTCVFPRLRTCSGSHGRAGVPAARAAIAHTRYKPPTYFAGGAVKPPNGSQILRLHLMGGDRNR